VSGGRGEPARRLVWLELGLWWNEAMDEDFEILLSELTSSFS
jgi:hypothetical protein